MKKTTGLTAFALLAAVVAAGCGSENPTGPSMARSTPPLATSVAEVPISDEPGTVEVGTWTEPEELDAVDARTGKKAKKPKNPLWQNGVD